MEELNMEINRRTFVHAMGVGAASLGLANAVPGLVAQADNATKSRVTHRKMVIRADDIGMSKVCNIGTFDAIEAGMISVAAVMLCDPGTEDALERLKAYPWLSVDWHMHMWGSPVADHKLVPSLLEQDKSGPFADRFRMDLATAQDVEFDEAVTELRAQLIRCDKILGRVPDTGAAGNDQSPWGRAVHQVTEEFNIVYNFSANEPTPSSFVKHIKDAQDRGEAWAKYWPATASPGSPADPKWASRKITSTGLFAFIDLLTDSISSVEKNYDPVLFYTEDRSGILKTTMDTIRWQAWHPGYIDYYAYRLGERVNRARAQQFVISRVQDSWAMRDPRLKNWIKENQIELVSFRDALYGTSEFQNHLKAVGSDLCMI
jgi:predicted glycoside hydrolase/deacetylase ChbG (UPF0249 family)